MDRVRAMFTLYKSGFRETGHSQRRRPGASATYDAYPCTILSFLKVDVRRDFPDS